MFTLDIFDYFNINNKYQVTGKKNPYKDNTQEAILVNCVINCINKNKKLSFDYILSQFTEHKINSDINSWNYNNYIGRAYFLAQISHCIDLMPHSIQKKKPIFGIYLESGLEDISQNAEYINKLIEDSPTKEGYEHLKNVAKITHFLRKKLNIPTIKQKTNKVEISNLEQWQLSRINLNNHLWANSDITYVQAATRGIFHHLGDEFAFILAAIEYGYCYIVSNDEIGNLIVLQQLFFDNSDNGPLSPNKVYSQKDFDYIYSVPKMGCTLLGNNSMYFNYNDKDISLINNEANKQLDNSYYLNDYFLSKAQRNMQAITFSQMIDKIINCYTQLMNEKEKKAWDYLMNEDLNIYSENEYHYINKYLDNDFGYNQQKCQKIDEQLEIIDNFINMNEDNFLNKATFFYKTISHKEHCDILNPIDMNAHGFFNKDGNSDKLQKINLKHLISYLLKDKQLGINFNTSIHNYVLNNFMKQHSNKKFFRDIIQYWHDLDLPAFIVSDLIDMQNEYRIFMINARPVCATPCFRNTTPFNAWQRGRFDPRLCDGHSAKQTYLEQNTRNRVAEYAKFAKKFGKEMKQLYPDYDNYVLDVCYSKDANNGTGGIIPIEINNISLSGAYQIDMRRLCASIANKPFYLSEQKNLNNYEFLLNIVNKTTTHIDKQFQKLEHTNQTLLDFN